MKRRKWITVLGVLTLVLLVFAVGACGDDGDGDIIETTSTTVGGETSEPTSTDTTGTEGTDTTGPGMGTDVTLPDLSGQRLEVAAVWTAGEQENFQMVLDEFSDLTGAEVTFTSTGNDIATVLGTRIQGGSPPDVAMLPQPGLMQQLVEQDALLPIDDVVGDVASENYAPIWADLGTVDDTQYGLLWKAANKSTVWYNIGTFEQAGVEPPAAWEDFLTSAQTIADSGVTPISVAGADGWTLTDWFENVYLQTAGPEMYDQLTDHEIPWTDESVRTALTRLQEAWTNDFVAGGNSGALQVTFPESVIQVFGQPPQAGLVYEADFVAGVITSETEAELSTDADFFPFPSIDGAPTSVIVGGDTAVLMNDSDAGRAFMQFLAMPESAQIWVERGGFTSPNQNVSADAYPNPILGRAAEMMANAEQVRFDMSDMAPAAFGGTPGQGMWKFLQDFLADPTQIDSIMQQLEQAASQAYGG